MLWGCGESWRPLKVSLCHRCGSCQRVLPVLQAGARQTKGGHGAARSRYTSLLGGPVSPGGPYRPHSCPVFLRPAHTSETVTGKVVVVEQCLDVAWPSSHLAASFHLFRFISLVNYHVFSYAPSLTHFVYLVHCFVFVFFFLGVCWGSVGCVSQPLVPHRSGMRR
ncbi:hypothetical protein E2C01_056985 [Portunus trituberculatus]|uniref:Uncharacterized protein n=1 Tax=Portunus trituberculatus TaxID=210409 RepID=A0A5B7GZU7_PORTR|nr:hypothetical protein [Portunus trituberculatus]